SGATADNTTVNADGKLQVNAGGAATNVTQNAGGALVTNTSATVSGTNSLGDFSVDAATASATNVLLENGGRLDVRGNGSADTTKVNQGGILA
ncbi:autotransporter adhesin family protein, partial [Klebsiella pneumoniae]|uniref:AIDA repeat-containing protein n=1 Tax=Klebsiella pneumoniae TaxID=573 RepID=UPI00200FA3F3